MDRENMPQEIEGMYKAIAATVKLCRWVYEISLENGFTPAQSLEMSKAYMAAMVAR